MAILQDLQGPKIRVGKLVKGELQLERGSEVVLVAGHDAEAGQIPCSHEALARDVEAGDPILLDDGRLRLAVLAIEGKTCAVESRWAACSRIIRASTCPAWRCPRSPDAYPG